VLEGGAAHDEFAAYVCTLEREFKAYGPSPVRTSGGRGRFDTGAHLTLFLADPVPPGTVEIIVWWRGRVARLEGGGVARVIRAGAAAWERRLALLRRVAPKDLEAAAKVLATRGADGDWPADVLHALPHPVLAGLAELQRDPTRPWRTAPTPDDPATPATPKTYGAGRGLGQPVQGVGCAGKALPRAARHPPRPPAEVGRARAEAAHSIRTSRIARSRP
jgi:hypothetical protein